MPVTTNTTPATAAQTSLDITQSPGGPVGANCLQLRLAGLGDGESVKKGGDSARRFSLSHGDLPQGENNFWVSFCGSKPLANPPNFTVSGGSLAPLGCPPSSPETPQGGSEPWGKGYFSDLALHKPQPSTLLALRGSHTLPAHMQGAPYRDPTPALAHSLVGDLLRAHEQAASEEAGPGAQEGHVCHALGLPVRQTEQVAPHTAQWQVQEEGIGSKDEASG